MSFILELVFFAILGLAVGSFLTVVAERIDTVESIFWGRSHCNKCKRVLTWWELLPLAGYWLVRGSCRTCRSPISQLYPVFEVITALAFVSLRLATHQPLDYYILIANGVVVSLLLILVFYDWLHHAFPASILWTALGAVLVIDAIKLAIVPNQLQHFWQSGPYLPWLISPASNWLTLILGGVVGGVLLGLLAFPSQGKWMGYGDVILIVILGFWLGYPYVLLAILVAFYTGALVGVWQLASRTARKDHHLAFGPFLILGALITQAWGQNMLLFIMKWWGGL